MAQPDATTGTETAPRHPVALAVLTCSLVTLLLAWPALGGGFLVNPHSDQYIAGYAFREFAAHSLRTGHGFPLWNPYLFGGMPYVAAMHGDIFYPTFLLRLLLPTDIAMTWGFVIHVALAGVFTFGFLQASGVRVHASLTGAVAYLLSGAVASYASPGHDGKLFVSALLPAALWALLRGVRDGRTAAWGWLALVVGMAVLSPHPQLLQYLLLSIGAFACLLVLRPLAVASDPAAATASRPPAARHLVFAIGAVLVGGVIGAIQYLPVREYVDWSPRTGGKGYEYATSFSLPLEETLNFYLPQFSGILDHYWGRNGIHLHSEYAGAVALVLACFAFGGGLANRHRAHAWFWLGTLITTVIWALGGNTPFYQLVYAIVPGSKYFRAPSTIIYVTAFSTAVLAAFGTERVLNRKMTTRYATAWGVAAVAVAVIASTGALTSLAMSILGDQRADAIQANASSLILGAWRSATFVVLTAVLMLACARGRVAATTAGWLLIALVAADLWSVERQYWLFSQRASALYAEDPVIAYLKRQTQPGRVIALPLNDNMAPHDPFLTGDALMQHGIRGALGYHGNELGRFQALDGKNEGYRSIANPNFWMLANARFFYTNANGLPFPGARLVAGPVRNAAGTMTYLYELPGEHPLAWVAPMVVKLDDIAAKATVLNPLFDVRRVAIFEPSARVTAMPVDATIPERVPFGVQVTRIEPGAIDLRLGAPAPSGSALVVSENFYPGWTALVDGRAVAIGRADFTLIGVPLEAGARTVSLRFASASYEQGLRLTLAALTLTVAFIIAGVMADWRLSRPTTV